MSLNAKLASPDPPGDWVDERECRCGEKYEDFHPGITWDQGVQLVRTHNNDNQYWSRGPVLWAMRTLKLDEWYWRHRCCGRDDPDR